MKKIPLSNCRRILVISLVHFGDALLIFPALQELWENLAPDAEFDLLLHDRPGMKEFFGMQNKIRRVLAMELSSLSHQLNLIKKIRKMKYDLVIDFTDSDRSHFFSKMSGASYHAGFYPYHPGLKGGRWWKLRNLNHVFPKRSHDYSRAACFIRSVQEMAGKNEEQGIYHYSFILGEKEREWARQNKLYSFAASPVFIYPEGRGEFKSWTEEGYNKLIAKILEKKPICLVASTQDGDVPLSSKLSKKWKHHPRFLSFLGKNSLLQISALLNACSLYVGADTGPMHLAAGFGLPVLGIFGPSNFKEWRPWSVVHEVVTADRKRFPCLPCDQLGCENLKKSECLHALKSDEVWKAFERLEKVSKPALREEKIPLL